MCGKQSSLPFCAIVRASDTPYIIPHRCRGGRGVRRHQARVVSRHARGAGPCTVKCWIGRSAPGGQHTTIDSGARARKRFKNSPHRLYYYRRRRVCAAHYVRGIRVKRERTLPADGRRRASETFFHRWLMIISPCSIGFSDVCMPRREKNRVREKERGERRQNPFLLRSCRTTTATFDLLHPPPPPPPHCPGGDLLCRTHNTPPLRKRPPHRRMCVCPNTPPHTVVRAHCVSLETSEKKKNDNCTVFFCASFVRFGVTIKIKDRAARARVLHDNIDLFIPRPPGGGDGGGGGRGIAKGGHGTVQISLKSGQLIECVLCLSSTPPECRPKVPAHGPFFYIFWVRNRLFSIYYKFAVQKRKRCF